MIQTIIKTNIIRNLIIINLLFFVIILAASNVISNNIKSFANYNKCSQWSSLKITNTGSYPILNGLNRYQNICNSYVGNHVMVFTEMPVSKASAKELASYSAKLYKDFKKQNIVPITIIEPIYRGERINFKNIASGMYEVSFYSYFDYLRIDGLSSSDLGIVIPFPEPNLPSNYWQNGDAKPWEFADMINLYAHAQKFYFPSSKIGIMMNSTTFQPWDHGYRYGERVSYKPYISSIVKGLVDEFFIQGFTWVSNDGSQRSYDPYLLLNYNYIAESANILGTRNIWIHTGSHSAINTAKPKVTLTFAQRQQFHNDLLQLIDSLRYKGYSVSFSLFAENKQSSEGNNWSYLYTQTEIDMFKNFANELNKRYMKVSIFDK